MATALLANAAVEIHSMQDIVQDLTSQPQLANRAATKSTRKAYSYEYGTFDRSLKKHVKEDVMCTEALPDAMWPSEAERLVHGVCGGTLEPCVLFWE